MEEKDRAIGSEGKRRPSALLEYPDERLKEREEMASLSFQVIATLFFLRVAFNINPFSLDRLSTIKIAHAPLR